MKLFFLSLGKTMSELKTMYSNLQATNDQQEKKMQTLMKLAEKVLAQ